MLWTPRIFRLFESLTRRQPHFVRSYKNVTEFAAESFARRARFRMKPVHRRVLIQHLSKLTDRFAIIDIAEPFKDCAIDVVGQGMDGAIDQSRVKSPGVR
jgi:hypothetical protein